MNGSRYEREAVNLLADNDCAVLRAPASGSSTERDLPDFIAARRDETTTGHLLWAVEHKARSGDHAYFTRAEVDALTRFADRGGYTPLLMARFKRDTTHYARRPDDTYRTDGDADSDAADGRYRLSRPESTAAFDGLVVDPDDGIYHPPARSSTTTAADATDSV